MNDFSRALAVGQTLQGRYTILEMAARGGMSTIYRAADADRSTVWAIKQMSPLQARPDDLASIRAQFRQEAEILRGLQHPGIPRVRECFTEGDVDYLVEEFIEGFTLEHRLEVEAQLSEFEATRITLDLLDIIAYLHAHRIIYRDVKPSNIMLAADGRVVLIDFGIARLYTPGKSHDTVVVGTPGFASPEHYGRGQTDERSDIFSVGATLHQMLTGRDPADAPFSFAPPSRLVPGVSAALSEGVMRAVELQPARRFQSATSMREALASTRRKPPDRTVFTYSSLARQPAPVMQTGLIAFLGSVVGTAVDLHALWLFPLWLTGVGLSSVVRGASLRKTRIRLRDDGLVFETGASETFLRWEDIREIRIQRTSSIDRTLWGHVTVYPASVELCTSRGPMTIHPSLSDWESLVAWTVYRAGLRPHEGSIEGADRVYVR